ncbi:response regulator [Erythrobacter colymbi]|uniref:response regulator n=1 Tax=Erythrobacter colymbi TaxID=1161202 RepID=UPI00139028A8|nr:response regulator [Erythrobacter colymbi]
MTDRTLSGCRIVILEDDYYQASDCRFILEQEGAHVVAVTSRIPDLSALLAQGRIDVVLIDINLGYGLSFDFARELKGQAIPFVFLTGYDAAMLPDDLAGSAYLSKPADGTRIVAMLAEMTKGAV